MAECEYCGIEQFGVYHPDCPEKPKKDKILSNYGLFKVESYTLKARLVFSYFVAWVFGIMQTFAVYGSWVSENGVIHFTSEGNVARIILNVHIVFSLMIFFGYIIPEIKHKLLLKKYRKKLEKEEQ